MRFRPFEGVDGRNPTTPNEPRMAVNTARCGALRASKPTVASTPGGIKDAELAALVGRSWAFAPFPPSTAPEGGDRMRHPPDGRRPFHRIFMNAMARASCPARKLGTSSTLLGWVLGVAGRADAD